MIKEINRRKKETVMFEVVGTRHHEITKLIVTKREYAAVGNEILGYFKNWVDLSVDYKNAAIIADIGKAIRRHLVERLNK